MQKIPQAVAMILLISALGAPVVAQQTHSSETPKVMTGVRAKGEIANLLHEFLSRVDDPAMHERFWANDVIYVGATGVRRTKEEILKSVRESAAKGQHLNNTDKYDAEDVTVRQYGDVAVLNFKLVAHSGDKTDYYRNSGTFVKNNGEWQAVSWQATKIANPEGSPSGDKKPTGKG